MTPMPINPQSYVRCIISGELRPATEEEKMRQWVAGWLMNSKDYSAADMRLEFTIKIFGNQRKRVDIAVFRKTAAGNRYTQDNIFMVVECK
jgi:Type I restriction enzyme R protein N terminus (HSDR_N)